MITPQEFANKIRAKYPQGMASDGRSYADIPDEELSAKIVQKYPAYKTQVDIPVQTSFKAKIGGAETIPGNVARTFGNIPSDAGQIVESTVVNPAKNIGKSVELTKDIYKDRGAVEGTKDIAKGFVDTAEKIAKAPGEIYVGQKDKVDLHKNLAPIQDQMLKQRDEITQKLVEAHNTGKDTSHLLLALKYAQENIDSINSQIGTKEENDSKDVNTLTNIAKFPIEHPLQTAIAVQEGGKALGVEDPIHSVASTVTKPVTTAIKSVTPDLGKYYQEQEKEIFAQPTTVSKPAYNKATEIANNGKGDPADTLIKNGVKSSDIIDGKVYNTTDTVDQIRQDAMKLSNEGLRPAIEQASYSTPKTSVEDVIDSATKEIEKSKNITLANKAKQLANLKEEGALLQEKYPDGMSLLDMHDNRITYSLNGGFSPIGDPSVNNAATVNRAFSKTLDNLVAENVPEDLPYEAFQKELARQFQATDYLNALHGKPVPRSILQNVAKTTAKVAGAATGNAIGGGILGTVGGYHLGGTLESAFENMSNPVKSYFLRNIEQTNPEAFTALKEYLGTKETSKLMQLALPAPTEESLSKIAIPLNGPAPKGAEVVAAEKYATSQNPATGKFQKVYSSSSLDQSGSVSQPTKIPINKTNISSNITENVKKVKKK